MPNILTRQEIDELQEAWEETYALGACDAETLFDTARYYWRQMVNTRYNAEFWFHKWDDSQEHNYKLVCYNAALLIMLSIAVMAIVVILR